MLSKNDIKRIRSLQQKKYRKLHRAFLVEGEKSVNELLKSRLKTLQLVFTPRMSHVVDGLSDVNITETDEATMKTLSTLSTPAGILAIASIPEYDNDTQLQGELVLALDGITDPGNLGTIIRTADWFGISDVLCSENTVDLYNPKTVQATMGSFVRVRVHYVSLPEKLTELKAHFQLLGLAMNGAPLTSVKSNIRKLLITGSEANGLSQAVANIIDQNISIPAYQKNAHNKPESLNASIATAIACYEMSKK